MENEVRISRQASLNIDDELTELTWLQDLNLWPKHQQNRMGIPERKAVTENNGPHVDCRQVVEGAFIHTDISNKGGVICRRSVLSRVSVHEKPHIKFSALIYMAINSSPLKQMAVKDIYQWIMTNYPYYKHVKSGWKNSVRHNLSLNNCFMRVDNRVVGGKGSLWLVHPRYARAQQAASCQRSVDDGEVKEKDELITTGAGHVFAQELGTRWCAAGESGRVLRSGSLKKRLLHRARCDQSHDRNDDGDSMTAVINDNREQNGVVEESVAATEISRHVEQQQEQQYHYQQQQHHHHNSDDAEDDESPAKLLNFARAATKQQRILLNIGEQLNRVLTASSPFITSSPTHQ